MSEINQNTDTMNLESSGEPIVRSGSSSESIASFDELESIMGGKAKHQRHEDADTPKIKKRGGDDDEPEGKVASKKKAEKVVEDETDEPQPKKPLEDDGKQDQSAAAKNVKTIKIKNGETDLELRSDSKIPVKVAGKEELVSLEELRSDYSGRTDWTKKYTALDTERKTFHAERQELQSGIDQLYDVCVTQNKPLEAIQMLTEMLGGDGVKQILNLREQMLAQFDEYSRLTPEQRKIRESEEKAELLESKLKRRELQDQRKSEQTKLAERISDVKTKTKMDDARYEEIETSLKKAGNIPDNEITPELIGNVHTRWVQMDDVDDITAELKLEGETLEKARNALLSEWNKDKSLTKAQIKAIAQTVFGSQKGKSPMQRKLEKNSGSNTDTSATRRKLEEPTFFDDLE